jgi:ATP/maltotriose-dependent transcriptional regulator MalT
LDEAQDLAEAELLLLQGKLSAAERKLNEVETLTQPELSKSSRMAAHLRARFLAASGKAQPALAILRELEQTDLADGALRRRMSVHLTQALVYHNLGERARARSIFEAAIKLAAAKGYRSLFFSASWARYSFLARRCTFQRPGVCGKPLASDPIPG